MPTTTTIALSGQFHKTLVGGVDLSQYFDEIRITYQRDMIDITTFMLGGNPVTRSNIRGAMVSDLSLNGPYDPAAAKALEFTSPRGRVCRSRYMQVATRCPRKGMSCCPGISPFWDSTGLTRPTRRARSKFDCKIPDRAIIPAVYYGAI